MFPKINFPAIGTAPTTIALAPTPALLSHITPALLVSPHADQPAQRHNFYSCIRCLSRQPVLSQGTEPKLLFESHKCNVDFKGCMSRIIE